MCEKTVSQSLIIIFCKIKLNKTKRVANVMSQPTQKTAIILGATGLTGGFLLQRLLVDPTYSKIKLFSRRSIGFEHSKMTEYLGDVVALESFKKEFTGDAVFCCIGTTKAKTKNKTKYKAIDYGIPVKASQLAKENGIDFFAVISAMGASVNSPFFYNRTKGEMEQAVLAQGVPITYILRPSLIYGGRVESRVGEWVTNFALKVGDPLMVGCLKPYKRIHAQTIAMAMQKLSNGVHSSTVLFSDEVQKIAL